MSISVSSLIRARAHRAPGVFTGLEAFCSKSGASSIWQLLWKSLETLIANNDESEESRRGRAELVIAAAERKSIYVMPMNPTVHMTRMPFNSDLCLVVLIYVISAVD